MARSEAWRWALAGMLAIAMWAAGAAYAEQPAPAPKPQPPAAQPSAQPPADKKPQEKPQDQAPAAQPAPAPFGYEAVQEEARRLAAEPYKAPDSSAVPAELRNLGYDRYQAIRARPGASLWHDQDGFFRVQFFPVGFIYNMPVALNVVSDGVVAPLRSTADLFDWSDAGLKEKLPEEVGFAGFRLLFPLHGPEKIDEVAAFLGASYFRLLGREQVYGISARGLAIDTGTTRKEEFPYFRTFWLVKPKPEERFITIYALLDSPGVTGAYQFVLRPGTETVSEVKATLFARHDISLLGIAPLTSMFLAGENVDRRAADFRPEVHDSDGLLIENGAREWLWRPLTNPAELVVSSFGDKNPRGFGLMQRDRDFNHYQDLQALYHKRPSLWVEPLGDWGEGEVRLLEIPSNSEIHDNIAAFWVGKEPFRKGQRLETQYRLHALLEAPRFSPGARAVATRIGIAGLPGTDAEKRNVRRIVVDFAGGELAMLRRNQPVTGEVQLSAGKLIDARVEPGAEGTWRLTIDFEPEAKNPVEMRAYLRLYDEALSETWTYSWRPGS